MVILHPRVPNLQVCIMSWKMMMTGFISGERTANPFQDQESQGQGI